MGDRLLMFMRVAVIGLTGPRAGSNQAVMDATHFEDNLWPRWILGFEEKSCRCCQEGGKGGGEEEGQRNREDVRGARRKRGNGGTNGKREEQEETWSNGDRER